MQLIRFFASATLLTTLGSIAIACSSNDGNANTTDGACGQYAAAVTAYTTRCGGIVRDTGEERMKAACTSALSLPGTAISPQVLNTCANAVRDLSCTVDYEHIDECRFPAGTLAAGAVCVGDEQCASKWCKQTSEACGVCGETVAIGGACTSASRCVEDAACVAGKCTAVIRNPVGGGCDGAKGETCQRELYCDFNTRTCKAYVAVGGTCNTTTRCQDGLVCDATSKCVAPTRVAEGQACNSTTRCQSNLACDPSTNKCVKITFVGPGGDCSGTFTVCDQGSCDSMTKKCPTVIPDGGACKPDDNTQTCARYANCIDGKCALAGQVVCK